jgi:hypothetical protein
MAGDAPWSPVLSRRWETTMAKTKRKELRKMKRGFTPKAKHLAVKKAHSKKES